MGAFEQRHNEVVYLDEAGGETVVTHAVVADAGGNELARAPARDWARLTAEYAKPIREGRVNVVGATAAGV